MSQEISIFVHKHWGVIKNSFKEIVEFQIPPMMSYRRSTHFRDRLVKSEVSSKKVVRQSYLGKPKTGSYPCICCINCRLMHKGNAFVHPATHNFLLVIPTGLSMSCGAPVKKLYVGETTCDVKTRFNNHRNTIRKGRLDLPVYKHFVEEKHTEWDLKVMVIDHIPPLKKDGDGFMALKKTGIKMDIYSEYS